MDKIVNKEAYDKVCDAWQRKYSNTLIKEGPVDWEKYIKSKPRLLWLLKEAADDEKDLIRYLNKISNKDFSEYPNGWQKTMGCVVKTSYGILKGGMEWGTWANDAKELVDILKSIAVIEVNKLGGGARNDYKELQKRWKEFKELISKQLQCLSPNIVICGNTLWLLKELLDINKTGGKHGDIITTNDCLWIDAYHPGQSKIKHIIYYTDIIASLKEYNAFAS